MLSMLSNDWEHQWLNMGKVMVRSRALVFSTKYGKFQEQGIERWELESIDWQILNARRCNGEFKSVVRTAHRMVMDL